MHLSTYHQQDKTINFRENTRVPNFLSKHPFFFKKKKKTKKHLLFHLYPVFPK
jgi:hypothetical protein